MIRKFLVLFGAIGIAVGGTVAIASSQIPASAAAPSSQPAAIAVACPGPTCSYSTPTLAEQGAATDIFNRINLERLAPARGYTYTGSRWTLPVLRVAGGAEATAQAAAEWEASHETIGDYTGPNPAGLYTGPTGEIAGQSTDSAGIDNTVMLSYADARTALSAAPTSLAVGTACAPDGVMYFAELFYSLATGRQWAQARDNAEIDQNNVYTTSGGTVTTVTDATGTSPAANAFPQQPIIAGLNDVYATGVDWTCNGPTYSSSSEPTDTGGLAPPIVGMAATPTGGGYWLADATGAVSTHGNAQSYGSMAGKTLNAPITHIVATPDGRGYWLVASDGGVFAFGDAAFFGSMGGQPLNAPVAGITPTPTGAGYWLVASDGGVFAFGDARFKGSMGGQSLDKPVVSMAVTTTGGGYWLVAADGGVFAFGDARFKGSMGGQSLDKPVVSMAVTTTGGGYWLVAADGGVFAFGTARYQGINGRPTLVAPIVGMVADPATSGYWLVASDGGVFSYSAPFFGTH
jgi:hypothetical protein